MFGLDIGKMLSGEGGGGGNMLTNMIMNQLASPGVQKMIASKSDEIFEHVAQSVKADKSQVSFLIKQELVPVTDDKGQPLLESAASNGTPAVQKTERKAIIYIMVGSKAVQKIAIDQFLAMMTQGQGGG